MSRYAMAISLERCNGCNACVAACKVEHNGPAGILLTVVLEKEVGQYPNANRLFYPVLCNHCEEPPCVPVCLTKATYQREDGIVLINWNECIGCGACIQACPYEQRFYNKGEADADGAKYPAGAASCQIPGVARPPAGVPVKCDFCYHRVDAGGRPACVEACPTEARIFARMDEINELIARKGARTLLPEMGTSPHVFYF